MEEWIYTSTHPLDHTGPVTGSLYLYLLSTTIKKVITSQNRILCDDLGLKWLPGRKKNKDRISNKGLFPFYFVYASTMIVGRVAQSV